MSAQFLLYIGMVLTGSGVAILASVEAAAIVVGVEALLAAFVVAATSD